MLSGNNGILTRAGQAKIDTEVEQIIEEARLDILAKLSTKLSGEINEEELEQILTPKYGTLSEEDNILDRTLTTKDGKYQIPVSRIYNGTLNGSGDSQGPRVAYDNTNNTATITYPDGTTETLPITDEEFFTYSDNGDGTVTVTGAKSRTSRDDTGMGVYYEYSDGYYSSEVNIVIPETNAEGKTITKVGDYAFASWRNIETVVFPNTVVEIGNRVFGYSPLLTDDESYLGYRNCGSLEKVILGKNVKTIGERAFYKCRSLREITIPNSVTTIGDGAFESCQSLTNITIPNGVTNIRPYTFCYCRSLSTVIMSDNLTSIGEYAFTNCDTLRSVVIPVGVTSVGNSAFSDCYLLENIEIPDTVLTLGWMTFYRCSSLTRVKIPSRVTSIGASTFESCTALADVTIESGVSDIGRHAFYRLQFFKKYNNSKFCK